MVTLVREDDVFEGQFNLYMQSEQLELEVDGQSQCLERGCTIIMAADEIAFSCPSIVTIADSSEIIHCYFRFPSQEDISMVELILSQFAEVRMETESDRIAQSLRSTSRIIEGGIRKTVDFTCSGFSKGTEMLRKHIVPDSEPTKVDDDVKWYSENARQVSKQAADGAEFVFKKVSSAAGFVGSNIIKALPEPDEDHSRIGRAALDGFVNVWDSMIDGVGKVMTNVADNSASVASHKYGKEVGEVVRDCGHTVGNTYQVTKSASILSTKSLAKTTMKSTARSFTSESLSKSSSSNTPPETITPTNSWKGEIKDSDSDVFLDPLASAADELGEAITTAWADASDEWVDIDSDEEPEMGVDNEQLPNDKEKGAAT